jgi:hypothetical protein
MYNLTGSTEITCTDCASTINDVTGELVGETDEKEVYAVVCDCGNEGEVIRETTLGGGIQIADGFEEF